MHPTRVSSSSLLHVVVDNRKGAATQFTPHPIVLPTHSRDRFQHPGTCTTRAHRRASSPRRRCRRWTHSAWTTAACSRSSESPPLPAATPGPRHQRRRRARRGAAPLPALDPGAVAAAALPCQPPRRRAASSPLQHQALTRRRRPVADERRVRFRPWLRPRQRARHPTMPTALHVWLCCE